MGCSIRSTGSNENMSRAQGINTDLTKIIGLMLSNGIVALSSGLLAQYQGFADINMGRGAIVIGLGCGHHRRSRIRQNQPQLCIQSADSSAWIHYLLLSSAGCFVVWLKF